MNTDTAFAFQNTKIKQEVYEDYSDYEDMNGLPEFTSAKDSDTQLPTQDNANSVFEEEEPESDFIKNESADEADLNDSDTAMKNTPEHSNPKTPTNSRPIAYHFLPRQSWYTHLPIFTPRALPKINPLRDLIVKERARIEHLITSGVFKKDNIDWTMSRNKQGHSALFNAVHKTLFLWKTALAMGERYRADVTVDELVRRKDVDADDVVEGLGGNMAVAGFHHMPSTEKPSVLEDATGNILAIRLRIKPDLIQQLRDAFSKLPPISGKRSSVKSCTYALWTDFSRRMYFSKDYVTGQGYPEVFLEETKDLITLLGNLLRLLDPDSWKQLSTLKQLRSAQAKGWVNQGPQRGPPNTADPPPANAQKIRPLGGVYHGVALKEHSVEDAPHKNIYDPAWLHSCIVPFGESAGGEMVIWETKTRMQLVQGDVLFVKGAVLTHNCAGVTNGMNTMELFVHADTVNVLQGQALRSGKMKFSDNKRKALEAEAKRVREVRQDWARKRRRVEN